ncbi:MAG: nucleotidyltransferase family protein [Candidatus Melainabacteria bacterium]|nr:nucleotidyltransferase family protein [Candidatus Melainabacteria bacterium]
MTKTGAPGSECRSESSPMLKYSIAILAAGRSQRMGRAKQTTIFEGETLLARAIRVALESEVGDVKIVLGYQSEQIAASLQNESVSAVSNKSTSEVSNKSITSYPNYVSIIVNDDWAEGIASSIRSAVQDAIDCGSDALLFMACDQPYVDNALLRSLIEAFERTSKPVVASYYGTPGIPAIFAKEKFSELLLLTGDKGAKRLILESDAHLVPAPLAQHDVDTEADLDACRLNNQEENDRWLTKNALAVTTTLTRKNQIFPDEAFSKELA